MVAFQLFQEVIGCNHIKSAQQARHPIAHLTLRSAQLDPSFLGFAVILIWHKTQTKVEQNFA